jgi:hypothetical protein
METRVFTVTHAKTGHCLRPVIRFQGDWLDEIGFTSGQLVAGEYAFGKIILRLLGSGNCEGPEIKASSGLFQVRREKRYSQIDLKGIWLERFGFTIGSVIAARYEYGLIKLLLIDPDRY